MELTLALGLYYLFRHPGPSNLSTFASGASWLANSAESAKCRKYSSLIPSFHFSPLCVETLGAWGSCAHSLVRQIGSRVMEQPGDNRATQFLIQKVAIDVQRGNATYVMAKIPSFQDWLPLCPLFKCLFILSLSLKKYIYIYD